MCGSAWNFLMYDLGYQEVSAIKYFGVGMGNIAAERAFPVPMATTLHRAWNVASLGQTIVHEVHDLKQWVLPVLCLMSCT